MSEPPDNDAPQPEQPHEPRPLQPGESMIHIDEEGMKDALRPTLLRILRER